MRTEQAYTFTQVDRPDPRLVLYVGKGGVGKTTSAAATAVRSAQLGHKTLVTSTDVAHSLGDVLDTPLGPQPTEVADGLWAQEISAVADLDDQWHDAQQQLARVLRHRGLSAVAAEELSIVPGMDEIVSLIHIRRLATERQFDRVIIDAAPTGETVRLLTVPDTFRWYAAHLGRSTGAMATALRPMTDRLLRGPTDLLALLQRLDVAANELKATLTDPQTASYRVVIQPERMVIREAERALGYLALFDYPVDAVVINRILGDDAGTGPFLDDLRRIQGEHLADIERNFAPLPLLRAPLYPDEVIGLDRLADFADACFGPDDPGQVYFTGRTRQIRQQPDGSSVLELPLPFADAEDLDLRKRGDELFIRIGSFKREMILPRALSSREPVGAHVGDGLLTIRFHPGEATTA
ncbi:MAG: ArsA family ATPase, partial [Actinomycetota bacterium]